MMIHAVMCQSLNLPQPKSYETQSTYILRAMYEGHELNTRICRYIGIHNLHSVAADLFKKRHSFVLKHGRVACPFTGKTPPFPVDIIYMTKDQREKWKAKKKPAEA